MKVVRRRAGEGEFGIVHKATWCGTLVAAKILKTSSSIALGDFRSEIEVLRRVHHPNAVQARHAWPSFVSGVVIGQHLQPALLAAFISNPYYLVILLTSIGFPAVRSFSAHARSRSHTS